MSINREELEIQTHDGIRLRAVYTAPNEAGAAVLLLSGGGTVGAQGDVSSPFVGSGYKGKPAPLNEQLAFALLESGIASLRFDKRGFTDPAQLATQTLPNLVSDASRALALLRDMAPGAPIFLVGLSEGALVATLLSANERVDGLFLLSPPTRPYPEILEYQFIEWPIRVLRKLDSENRGWITKDALYKADVPHLPLGDLDAPLAQFGMTLPSLKSELLPFDERGRVSFDELAKIYRARFEVISALLQAPFMKALYESYLALPPFEKSTNAVSAPVHVYIGLADSQIDPEWMREDIKAFSNLKNVTAFPEYGHCFAPMMGVIGQGKTSGPFSADLLGKVKGDILKLLSAEEHAG